MVGGQARLPFSPTPGLRQTAMEHAHGLKKTFPWLPLDTNNLNSLVGALMCLSSVLLAVPATRQLGAVLSGSITVIGWYSQIFLPSWLPIMNTMFTALLWYISGR